MNRISIKKQRFYFVLAIYIALYFSPLFWRGAGGEVFSQQLSPRYIRMPGTDGKTHVGEAAPTGINGEMVGFWNTADPGFIPFLISISPHLYRLDSTGKYIGLIDFDISSPYDIVEFTKVIPFKDSLYIIGYYNDIAKYGTCEITMPFILKTDRNGAVSWKKTWGDVGVCDIILDPIVCSDGGIAFLGLRSGLQLPNINVPNGGNYTSFKPSIVKLNADGSVKFNKSYQIPDSLNIAGTYVDFTCIVETADKGYLVTGQTFSFSYPTTSPYGLLMLKVDANGNKVWEKVVKGVSMPVDNLGFVIADIIPHPDGGYVAVGGGTAPVNAQDTIVEAAAMLKISETGNVEWIKLFHMFLKNKAPWWVQGSVPYSSLGFSQIALATSTVTTGFIISGMFQYDISPDIILNDGDNGGYDSQALIVKTDLSGNLLWDREYGSLYESSVWSYWANLSIATLVYVEPGGSMVLNTHASADDLNLTSPIINPLTNRGILRLNDQGYLGDQTCSPSPKLLVYNAFVPPSVSIVTFETTPTPIGQLGTVNISSDPFPATISGVCGNPMRADFNYQIICSATGTESTVKFDNASSGGSYIHYNFGDPASGANNISDSASAQHIYSSYGTYTVTLTIWDGDSSLTATISKAIELKVPRYITMLPGNTTICEGTAVNLTATISSGYFPSPSTFSLKEDFAPNYADSFTDTTYNSRPLSTTFYAQDPLNRIFSFYIATNDKCIFSDTLVVTVIPTVNVSVTGTSPICVGDSSLLIASGSDTYLWNPGSSANDSLWVYPSVSTTYTVSSGQTNVCGTNTAQLTISVYALPTIDAGENQTIDPEQEAQLTAGGGISYLWNPGNGLSSVTIANPTASPEQTTTYTVTGIDANGCTGSDTVTVVVNPPCSTTVFVPTAFSPNNDGINELECVLGNSNCIQTFSFAIFDRWGNLVFKTEDPKICWDGKYKGKAMNPAVFVYSLQGTLKGGGKINQKGNISLVR